MLEENFWKYFIMSRERHRLTTSASLQLIRTYQFSSTLFFDRKQKDWRTRRDRVQDRTEGFKRQMEEMVDAYLEWDVELGDGGLGAADPPAMKKGGNGLYLRVIDVFSEFIHSFGFSQLNFQGTRMLQTDAIDASEGVPASLIRQGLIPCAPYRPTLAVTTRLLELFRCTHLRCPHLSIHAFIKGICDLHGLAFQPYLSTQFSICYDLLVEIRANVQKRVDAALNRDSPNWRLRNACPACTYKLEDEPPLVFDMLVTMDGNDSLKRVIRKDVPGHSDEGAPITAGTSREVIDTRDVNGDYYIDRSKVDRWAKDPVMGLLQQEGTEPSTGDNPCASRWSNMSKEVSSRMWGVFDETGIFICLCRHGYVLTVADMVRSGEQCVVAFLYKYFILLNLNKGKVPVGHCRDTLGCFWVQARWWLRYWLQVRHHSRTQRTRATSPRTSVYPTCRFIPWSRP